MARDVYDSQHVASGREDRIDVPKTLPIRTKVSSTRMWPSRCQNIRGLTSNRSKVQRERLLVQLQKRGSKLDSVFYEKAVHDFQDRARHMFGNAAALIE